MCVTICSQNLDNTVTDFDDGTSKVPAAQVINHDFRSFSLSRPYASAADVGSLMIRFTSRPAILPASFVACLLRVIEVSRNSDNCLCYGFAQITPCVCFQLLQNHSRDFLRRICLAFNVYLIIFAHVALDGRNSVVVGFVLLDVLLFHQSVFRRFFAKADNRGCRSCTVVVYDNNRLTAFHYCYTRVCCT